MIPEGLRAGVDLGEGSLRAEAQPDDTGGHPLRQAQSRHDLTGLAMETGGTGGDADALTAQIVYHVLAGASPAMETDRTWGALPLPMIWRSGMAVSFSTA